MAFIESTRSDIVEVNIDGQSSLSGGQKHVVLVITPSVAVY
jgi:hypothetical protein